MEGLVAYDSLKQNFTLHTPHKGLTAWNEIRDIDTIDNLVWCATGNGVRIFDPVTKKFHTPEYFTRDNTPRPVYWIHRDRKGFIWASVWNDGIYRFDPRTKTSVHFDGKDQSYGELVEG